MINAVAYVVVLPAKIVKAAFELADRIYHYVVDRGRVRITGYQNSMLTPYIEGLPQGVTAQDIQLTSSSTDMKPVAAPDQPQVATGILAAASVTLLALVWGIAMRTNRRRDGSA